MMMIQAGDVAILHWEQDVRIDTVDGFKQAVWELREQAQKQLILDLQGVQYLNSLSLGIISETVVSARRQEKEMVVAGISETVAEIFTIVKFHKFIRLFKQREEALAYFSHGQLQS
ncbi:anti-sigma B factor antagonist [Aneurinibacillus soli]|uniref:Anti-sigma factor antagonist n=1 Tax=Aneurinibacillus soli TaxID=1500254 RepID=A0A0U5BNX0_9BACL|nr:STAS domain-containing protein [Aneurinibacillus soli]PYE58040.1 anti-sigma B factor antagonist [Aneurinibacillus soli]BAU29918.1 STAS domain protein [Aneurinibacillus soli]